MDAAALPETRDRAWYVKEYRKCRKSFVYFVDNYCSLLVEDGEGGKWEEFKLWASQRPVAQALQDERLLVMLKARQLGMTWLVLAFALWLMLFYPVATVLLFSTRDDEAVELLAVRLRGMYLRLPPWLKAKKLEVDNDHELALSNGSRALAFPTNRGDSYTATLAIVDEADLSPDLDSLMRSVKPTIDAGGRMIVLSRADKAKEESPFKKLYLAAKTGKTKWHPIFLPWSARPARNPEWYEEQKADILTRTGALDDLAEQYPSSDVEALAPKSLDKRFPLAWLKLCYEPKPALDLDELPEDAPLIPGIEVYDLPETGESYLVSGDPAEGNPTSDDSSLTVLRESDGAEVCALAGKYEPKVFAHLLHKIGHWYNSARLVVERNNHGHAVILWLFEHSDLTVLNGPDNKRGWNQTGKGKPILLDTTGEIIREGGCRIRSISTFNQLASIEGATLAAPKGQHDDRAISFCLAAGHLVLDRGNFNIRAINVRPLPQEDAEMQAPRYPFVRWFNPHNSFQPQPELDNEIVIGAPDFAEQKDAAYFVVFFFQLLNAPVPPGLADKISEVADLPPERKARVESLCKAFFAMKGLQRRPDAPKLPEPESKSEEPQKAQVQQKPAPVAKKVG